MDDSQALAFGVDLDGQHEAVAPLCDEAVLEKGLHLGVAKQTLQSIGHVALDGNDALTQLGKLRVHGLGELALVVEAEDEPFSELRIQGHCLHLIGQ